MYVVHKTNNTVGFLRNEKEEERKKKDAKFRHAGEGSAV